MVSGTLLCPLSCCKEDKPSKFLSVLKWPAQVWFLFPFDFLIPWNQMTFPPELLWTVLSFSHMACCTLVRFGHSVRVCWVSAELSRTAWDRTDRDRPNKIVEAAGLHKCKNKFVLLFSAHKRRKLSRITLLDITKGRNTLG